MPTREVFNSFIKQIEENHKRAFYESDTIECRTLPISTVKRIAMANGGARLILHKWQFDELYKDGLIPLQ